MTHILSLDLVELFFHLWSIEFFCHMCTSTVGTYTHTYINNSDNSNQLNHYTGHNSYIHNEETQLTQKGEFVRCLSCCGSDFLSTDSSPSATEVIFSPLSVCLLVCLYVCLRAR